MRRALGWWVGWFALLCGVAAAKPNVVFILADDLGIGDVGCYGQERCRIETPNIDALAAGGLRFTDAHVNASHCIPTRVAIMTGRYPWRPREVGRGGAWGFLGTRFDEGTFTIGDLMRGAGYRTGYVGKWHLGTEMTTTDGKVQGETNVDYGKPLVCGPVQYGWDESFILPGSLDMYPYAYVRDNVWQGEVTAQKGWSAFNRVGPAAVDFEDHEVLETFYREAEAFVERAAARVDEPFFLFLSLTAPHTPTSPGKAWQGKSALGVYGDFVMEVDHAVERVVAALKAAGVYDETLVLFSSDHGAASYAGNILEATPGQIRELEKAGHYPSGIYRGYKFSVYEGGLRVPLVAHWPGVIEAGGECGALVGLNDLMATLAELSGGEVEAPSGGDSISFARLLREPGAAGARTDLVMQSVGPFVVRDGDWKLCLCPGSGAIGKYGNTPTPEVAWRAALDRYGKKPMRDDLTQAPFVQLFNLADDPGEMRNLAEDEPDRVAAMVALLRSQASAGGPERLNLHPRLPGFVREALK